MNKCEHCEKTFSSLSNLNHHKKTAKFCLEKQNFIIEEFKCKGCLKIFTTCSSLERHNQSCNIYEIIGSFYMFLREPLILNGWFGRISFPPSHTYFYAYIY